MSIKDEDSCQAEIKISDVESQPSLVTEERKLLIEGLTSLDKWYKAVNTPAKAVIPTESTPLNNEDIQSVVGTNLAADRQSKIDSIMLDEDRRSKKVSRLNYM